MKKPIFFVLIVLVLIAAIVVPAYAHPRGGFRAGIWIGPGPWWWGPPYYYPYPPAYYYERPPVIIEQQPEYEQPAPPQEEQQYYWYFCQDANAYYPYVKECPKGWLKVIPAPPRGKE